MAYFAVGFGTLREIFQDLAQNRSAEPARQMCMVFVDTAAYSEAGSPFHLARSSLATLRRHLTTSSPSPTQADEVVAA